MDKPARATGNRRLLAYLRLFRLPNVFTAIADVTMGFLFVQTELQPWPVYCVLALASSCLYLAGMVLNDVYDVEQDRQQRPERPIPAGDIPLATARRWGYALLVVGVFCGWLAPQAAQDMAASVFRTGCVATALAACVVAYDALFKKTPLAPILMGGCRFLNVLLGMSVGRMLEGPAWQFGFTTYQLAAAAGIGVYIAGVTWFARTEATTSQRSQLALGTIVAAGGLGLLAWLYRLLPPHMPTMDETYWLILIGLLAFTIIRRCSTAVTNPSPLRVQLAVKNAIWSLIVIDAAVVLLVCSPQWALALLALVIPTMLLGTWIEST
jgi:4-hydroxybenzoate polyprenyltransferase